MKGVETMQQMSFIHVEQRAEYRPKIRDLPVRERPVNRLRDEVIAERWTLNSVGIGLGPVVHRPASS